MALRTFQARQEFAQGNPQFGPLNCAPATALGTPPDGYIRLADDLDSTGFTLAGTAATPRGMTLYILGSEAPSLQDYPGNVTIKGETLIARAALTSCTAGTLRAYINTTPISIPVAVEAAFANLSFPLTDVGFFDGFERYFISTPTGLAVENDCAAGGAQTIVVSEASVVIDFNVPIPVVTTLSAADITPKTATLRGSLMVNQADIAQRSANPADADHFSQEFPVSWTMEFGLDEDTMDVIATGGPFYGTIAGLGYNNPDLATLIFEVPVEALDPRSTYFYRFTASHEDGTFRGDVLTLRPSFTDPVKGVY